MTEPSTPAAGPRPSNILLLVGSLLGVFVLYQAGGGLMTYLVIGGLTVTPENVAGFRAVTMVSQLLFILGPVLLIARYVDGGWRSVFPLRLPGLLESGVAVLAMLALQRVLETLVYLQSMIPLPEIVESLLTPVKELVRSMMLTLVSSSSTAELLAVLLVVAVVPAIVEEFFFRGLIQTVVEKVWNPMAGVVGSGLIFGLFHLNPFDVLGLMGLGVFLAYTRYRSGTMLVPVGLHFLNNALAVIAVQAGLGQDDTLFSSVGSEPSPMLMIGQGIVFGLFFVVLLRSYRRMTAPHAETVP